jgi:hypothetical protein
MSVSFSFADMDRYKAVTEYRLDWRADRPSCEVMVFCLETGTNDEVEDVEVLDGACSIVATDMIPQTKDLPNPALCRMEAQDRCGEIKSDCSPMVPVQALVEWGNWSRTLRRAFFHDRQFQVDRFVDVNLRTDAGWWRLSCLKRVTFVRTSR